MIRVTVRAVVPFNLVVTKVPGPQVTPRISIVSSDCMAVPFRSPRRAHVAKGKYPAVVVLRG